MAVFGILSAILAKVLARLYRDKVNVDRTFNAGGQLSMGLTSTTIVSEWTWAAAFGHTSYITTKYGISASYWYAATAAVQILLFAVICVEFRIRAPGAKTYLEVIRARFGKTAHIVVCIYGLLTNIILTNLMLIGGATVLSNMVKGLSVEFASTMFLLVIGTFCLLGGVRATSYISYFATMIIMLGTIIFTFHVYHQPSNNGTQLGSVERIYHILECTSNPNGTFDRKYINYQSNDAMVMAAINFVGSAGAILLDQAFWQRGVAAKPREVAWGFLSAGVVWFWIPFTFSLASGLAYVSLNTLGGGRILTVEQEKLGLIAAVVADHLLGAPGEFLIVLLVVMAVCGTGAAEVLAVVAIVIYDLYAVYGNPYRRNYDARKCLLCDKWKYNEGSCEESHCQCESLQTCVACEEDDEERSKAKQPIKPNYKCNMHKKYRIYSDHLEQLKDWTIVAVTVFILPLVIALHVGKVNQEWLQNFMGIVISSGVFPVILSMYWTRLTGKGVISGLLCGSFCGVVTWLTHASLRGGGLNLNTFMDNTGNVKVMLTGNCTSILIGLLISVVVSLFTRPECAPELVWRNTLNIDNPLSPWSEFYAEELRVKTKKILVQGTVFQAFRTTRQAALIVSLLTCIAFILIGPLIMWNIGIFSQTQFYTFICVADVGIIVGTLYMILFPVVTEWRDLTRAIKRKTYLDFAESEFLSLNVESCRQPI